MHTPTTTPPTPAVRHKDVEDHLVWGRGLAVESGVVDQGRGEGGALDYREAELVIRGWPKAFRFRPEP